MFKKLTVSEIKVMEYFWREQKALTCGEILEMARDEHWSSGYLHNTVRSLLEKEAIHVVGEEMTGKVWARRFEATLTYGEYVAKVALSSGIEKESVIYVILAMAQLIGYKEFEDEIQKLIQAAGKR
ncbi:MAG: hypothetical protein Q4F83_08990 [Eubacteriales bacterium]|nr:hypothetical protein [Eubacteriales bacterium]